MTEDRPHHEELTLYRVSVTLRFSGRVDRAAIWTFVQELTVNDVLDGAIEMALETMQDAGRLEGVEYEGSEMP